MSEPPTTISPNKWTPEAPNSPHLFRKAVYLSAIVAAIGGFLCGYDTGAASGILTMVPFQTLFFKPDTMDYQQGQMLAFFLMTAALGALCSGLICDYLSRKYSILGASVLFAIGILLAINSRSFGVLLIARLLGGFGVGLMTNAVPLYQSEIAPPDIRGRLISFFTVMSTFGQVVGYFVAFGTSHLNSDWSWRVPWCIQLVVCVIFTISMLGMPFSPRWLIKSGRLDQGLQVLSNLRESPIDDPIVRAEFQEIVDELDDERSNGSSTFAELFMTPMNRTRTTVALFVSISTAFTGAVAVWYYAPQILMSAGMGSVPVSLAATGGSGLLSLVVGTVSLYWCIDRWGRKTLFLVGSSVMGISMLVIGSMFWRYTAIDPQTGGLVIVSAGARNIVLLFMCIFSATYAFSWGLATMVYPVEVFSIHTRAKGLALTYSLNWVFTIITTYYVPILMTHTVSGVYFIFGACCILSFFGFWFIPETKGKTLEEISHDFGVHKRVLHLE